ncbi:MAG TPA: MFS transporter [Candidatus Methylomirabilis sp.]|nr:MFS transporter [Candidatus Methylomirabilis sp.]
MKPAIDSVHHESHGRSAARRWGVVAACCALMAVSSGAFYTGSLFFVAIIQEFGWSYASTASIFSIFTVLYGVWGIPIGHLVDRFGPRPVILGGGLLLPLALLGSGSAHALWQLYATHGILTALGLAATSYVPVSLILTRRFQEERGLAFGIASAGVGFGILVLVPLTQSLISLWGWRIAYRGLAIIASSVILPVGFFALRDGRSDPPSDAEDRRAAAPALAGGAHASHESPLVSALLSREFWLVAATYVFLNGPIALVQTHQVAHLTEVGQPAMLVAGIVGLIGLFSIPGKIGWGFLSDRIWLELIYLAGSVCVAAAILVLLQIGPASSVWRLYGYAVLLALGYAVAASMNPIYSGRFFAGRNFGVILGTLNTFYQGGAAVAIWVAGYAHDLTGSYQIPFLGAIVSVGMAASCAWLAAPRRIAPRRAIEDAA